MSPTALTELLSGRIAARGITQAEFARRVGAEQATVSRWLSGAVIPRPAVVPLIAEALGVEERAVWTARSAAQEERLKQTDRKAKISEQKHDDALAQVSRFVDTYEAFHAAYRQMGEQMDTLVKQLAKLTTDMVELKRDVRSLRPKGER